MRRRPIRGCFPISTRISATRCGAKPSCSFDSVMRDDRNVVDLLRANYTFLNERLARHYGIANVAGDNFRRVELPAGDPRGGLLGQGSILTLTSYATRTSPVRRGKWILETIVGMPPPPPPPNVSGARGNQERRRRR